MTRKPNGQFAPICDVCLMYDPYGGQGDGIGSCDCSRCEGGCGLAADSDLCPCIDSEFGDWQDEVDDEEEEGRPVQDLDLSRYGAVEGGAQ